MKLHIVPGSPHSRKVEAVVRHLGLDIEIVQHDLFAGDLRKPGYLALNSNARVPTLEDGKFVLWESLAIMQYIADKAGAGQLFPREPEARADVVRWQSWDLAHFSRPFATLAFEAVAKPRRGLQPDAAAIAQAQSDAGKLLGMTVPAVKAALHRGRLRLAALHTDAAPSASVVASPILAHYLELFNARDWGLIHPRRALRSVDQRGARF